MNGLEAWGLGGIGAGVLVCLFLIWRTHADVKQTKMLVETVNGRSLAILSELAEGRRIRDAVPKQKRTAREQDYVDFLERVEKEGTAHEVEEDVALADKGEETKGPKRRDK